MTDIEAIYRHGLFVPMEVVDLKDEQRVRLMFEPSEADNCWYWLRAMYQLHEAVIARRGVLPDSSTDIAADRLR